MREWVRAPFLMLCGGCRGEIKKGAAYLAMTTNRSVDAAGQLSEVAGGARLKRCATCAKAFGEEPPANVEDAVIVPQPSFWPGTPPSSQPFVNVGDLRKGRSPMQLAKDIRKSAPRQQQPERRKLASGED